MATTTQNTIERKVCLKYFLTKCTHCDLHHSTVLATINHLIHNGCHGSVQCYCRARLTKENAQTHMSNCYYFGPVGCSECPNLHFTSLEKANNHAWNTHSALRSYSSNLQPTVVFKMQAQIGLRFAHMQYCQLKERARNNTQKRTILKCLIHESNFANSESHFYRMYVDNKNRPLPCFKKTQGRMKDLTIQCADGPVDIRVNLLDDDITSLWTRLRTVTHLKAQGLFDFTMTHRMDPMMENLATRITALLESMHVDGSMVRTIISMICKLVGVVRSKFDLVAIAAAVLDCLISSGVTMEMANGVWDRIKDYVPSMFTLFQGGFRAQIGGLEPLASLGTVVAVIFGAMTMHKIPRESDVAECVTGVTKLGTLVRGLTFAWQGIEKVIAFVMRKIYEWRTGLPSELEVMEQYMDGVTKWFKDVQEIVNLKTADEIGKDSGLCARVETLHAEAARLAVLGSEAKVPKDIIVPFQLHHALVKTLYQKATSSGAFRTGPRVEPLVIYAYGTSGVGKSGLMFPLATDLLKIDGIPKNSDGKLDATREIYMRNVNQEYWDAYHGQRVVIYDDFAQIVDSAGNPNPEYMEMIRTGNLAPYPLHMASIEEKSKSFFTSRAIICTSNLGPMNLRPESIHCKEAVRRRFDMCVEITNNTKFTRISESGVRYLDPAKVKEITGKDHSMDVYHIWLIDPLTGRPLQKKPLSYTEFATMCCTKYVQRFNRSSSMIDFLAEYAEKPCLIAQGLSDDDMEKFKTQDDVEIELVSQDEIAKWNYDYFNAFSQEAHEHLKPFFNPDFNEFVEEMRNDPFTGKSYTEVEKQWTEGVLALPFIWTHSAVADIKRCRTDVFVMDNLAEVANGVRQPINRHTRRTLDKLVASTASFQTMCKSWKDRAIASLKECSWLTIGCAIAPIVLFALFNRIRNKFRSRQSPLLDHTHEGLKVGSRAHHWHICSWCKEEFEHVHSIKSVAESVRYPQLCRACTDAGVTSFLGSCLTEVGEETGFRLISKNEERFVPFSHPDLDYSTELSASGDPTSKRKEGMRVELTASGDPNTARKNHLRTETELLEGSEDVYVKDREEARAQRATDPNALQVSAKILTNMYVIELEIDGRWTARMKICFVVGRTALTAGHLIPYLEKCTRVKIWNNNNIGGHTLPVSSLKWVKISGADGATRDQMLIEFPRSVHDHSDIRGNIASSAEMTKFKSVHGVLISPCDHGAIMRYGKIMAQDREMMYSDKDAKYSIRQHYRYEGLETKDGDCGGILMGVSTGLARKILGLHVAGMHNVGISSPLNIADIEKGLKDVSMEAQISLVLDSSLSSVETDPVVELPEGDFTPIGKSLYTVASPTKTALRPSTVHGIVSEPSTAPSALRPKLVAGKMIDPMMQGLKKAGKIPPFLDEAPLAAAVNDFERIVNSNINPAHARVLTDMESVAGVEGDDFMAPINRKSSAGYPYTRECAGQPGKMKWLGSDEYKYDPELMDTVHQMEEDARNNKRSNVFWIDTLKDERRPLDKVAIAKTRVFSAGPMHYTVAFRKYFLGFTAHCARNRIDNEISVGTNVYSYDWTRTAERVSSKGNKVIAGDFSNFDGTLVTQILADIVEIINRFYDDGEENAQIRRVLWKEVINSVHIRGDNVYLWTHSQPSGCPITAILNSMFNSISMRYVWLKVVPAELATMRSFNEHVAMVSYGDDNVVGISDKAVEFFNQVSIAEGYATMGMTYTDEMKSGAMIPFRALEDVSYLKRKFRWDEATHTYCAPLELGVVLEMINWIRGEMDQEESTSVNMETSAFELSLHGREIFDKYTLLYKRASREFTERPLILTYEEYRLEEALKYGQLAAAQGFTAQVGTIEFGKPSGIGWFLLLNVLWMFDGMQIFFQAIVLSLCMRYRLLAVFLVTCTTLHLEYLIFVYYALDHNFITTHESEFGRRLTGPWTYMELVRQYIG